MKDGIINVFCAAVVAALGLAFAFEQQDGRQLAAQRRALETKARELDDLAAENRRLSSLLTQASAAPSLEAGESRELLKLRGEVGRLREQTKDLEAVRKDNQQAHAALENGSRGAGSTGAKAAATEDYWPQGSWTFKGFGTPAAALQSSLWAANNGDVKAVLASTTGGLHQMIEQDLADKPETEASVRAMDEVMGFKSVRVLGLQTQSDDTALLSVAMELQNSTQTMQMLMKKVDGNWKIAGVQP